MRPRGAEKGRTTWERLPFPTVLATPNAGEAGAKPETAQAAERSAVA